jgi:putative ABC transport system permease protein
MTSLLRRLWIWVRGGRFERDLDEELRFHDEMLRDAATARGESPAGAREAARRRLSSPLRTREQSRDAWGLGGLDRLLQDVRYALRLMARRPGFAATAIGVLALALGASITVFSVVYAVLLRPLPFPDADRLVLISEGLPKIEGLASMGFSPPDILGYAQRQRSFISVAAFHHERRELSGAGEAERLDTARADAALFATLGVQPALGRAFTADDDRGAQPVVVLSHTFWQRKFLADPHVLGTVLHLDRRPYTIVGVMPPRFEFPLRGVGFNDIPADVFVPLSLTPQELAAYGTGFNYFMVGRLKPAVAIEAARAESEALAIELAKLYPAQMRNDTRMALAFPMWPMQEAVVGNVRTVLWVLSGAVALVLLVGCADLGGLLLTRAAARAGELKVRAALGAGRGRLVRQLVTESLVIATIGGACGLALAQWLTTVIAAQAADRLPRAHEIALNGPVVIAAITLSVLAALACGLAPALWITDAHGLVISTRRLTGDTHERRLLHTLVILQVTLAIILAIGAGLLARSLERLLAVDPGFRAEHVVSATVALPLASYGHAPEIRGFFQRTLQALDGLPGAKAVALAGELPFSFFDQRGFAAERGPAIDDRTPPVAVLPVAGSYFATLGIALREGRFFTREDGLGPAPLVIINETLARRVWPDRSAVGQRIKWGNAGSHGPWLTVAGVVGDVKQRGLATDAQAQIYEPYWQVSADSLEATGWAGYRRMALIVRTQAETDPAVMLGLLRQRLQALDPSLPLTEPQTLDALIARSVSPQRFNAWLLSGFALTAVALAALGLYGLLASFVVSRTREIGVRVALGARRPDVLRLIVGQGARLVIIGLGLGLAGAALVTRFLQTLLFGVRPLDPLTFALVAAVLLVVGLLASLLPAWRAATIDPVRALRSE